MKRVAHFKMLLVFASLFAVLWLGFARETKSNPLRRPLSTSNLSASTERPRTRAKFRAALHDLRSQRVCQELKNYPRKPDNQKLSFEMGLISPLCQPFVRAERKDLDRCGDDKSDRFTGAAGKTASLYTWPSQEEMLKKNQPNIFTDPELQKQVSQLDTRIEDIRNDVTKMCCSNDQECRAGMAAVDVSVCRPQSDKNASDPCVHGGAFEMAGANYTSIYSNLSQRYENDPELGQIAEKNLPLRLRGLASIESNDLMEQKPFGGKIVLTSYVKRALGIKTLEPTLFHEFGHACTMVKMQLQAKRAQESAVARTQALDALKWFDQIKNRCTLDGDHGVEAYANFWESVGESRELAQCFSKVMDLNRSGRLDHQCGGLCPGHYLEETVGIAFSMLNGDLSGAPGSVFPQTCDHMRDRQHPMVADVVECLAQYSPKFRKRLSAAYGCAG